MKQNYLVNFYVFIRSYLRILIFKIFKKNSRVINFFVKIDEYLRRLGVLNSALDGQFTFEGIRFAYDKNDQSVPSSIITNNCYEPETLQAIKQVLSPGSIFIDGGANIGFFSLIASKLVGENGLVIAFEPTDVTRQYLIKNIYLNKLNNILVDSSAISISEGEVVFKLEANPEANSICMNHKLSEIEKNLNLVRVKSVSIDSFCENNDIKYVDLIKLDIEGQELNAIRGSKKTLLNNQKIRIIFELNIYKNPKGIEYAKNIFNELIQIGFNHFETLVEPKVIIRSLNTDEEVELLKKLTSRHNLNILAARVE